jgi:RimJ/RimL family protein N-acetyltransferase
VLRLATNTDIPELVRMALLFKEHSPYKDYATDALKIEELIGSLIASPEAIVILYNIDDKPVGMVIGLAREFIFSRDRHATELVWWVDPEFRDKEVGQELQEAFVFWANRLGCKYLHMTLLENEDAPKMRKMYKKHGFKLLEQAWVKEIK